MIGYEMQDDNDPENWSEQPPDKTMPSLNPFLQARILANKTQAQLGREINVSPLYILRVEQGLFSAPPDPIVKHYTSKLGLPQAWEAGYANFRKLTRMSAPRPITGMAEKPLDPYTFRRWRLHNWPNLSQIGWCKAFCVHPASVYAIENGTQASVPKEVLTALIEARIFSEDGARFFAYVIKKNQSTSRAIPERRAA